MSVALAVLVAIGVITWGAGGVVSSAPSSPPIPERSTASPSQSPDPDPSGRPDPSPDADPEPTPDDPAPSEEPVPSPDDRGSEPPGGGSLRFPEPSRGPIGDRQSERPRVTQAVTSVIDAMDQIGQRGDGTAIGADLIATGFVLGEMQAFAQEQYDLGHRQVGQARVVSVEVISSALEADPATMTIKVCVDVSEVDVRDASGTSLGGSLYRPDRPVSHLYGAVFADGVWKVATHDIPDVQDCAPVNEDSEQGQ